MHDADRLGATLVVATDGDSKLVRQARVNLQRHVDLANENVYRVATYRWGAHMSLVDSTVPLWRRFVSWATRHSTCKQQSSNVIVNHSDKQQQTHRQNQNDHQQMEKGMWM